MSTLTKTLLATLAITLAGGAAYVAASPGDRSSAPAAPAAVDLKGPCDEAEHAADPRCAAPQVPEDNQNNDDHRDQNNVDNGQVSNDDNPGHDVNDDNGANDVNDDSPGEVQHHGNRGPGNAEDRGPHNGIDDHSGPGSGSGDSSHSGSDDSGSSHSGSGDSGSGQSGSDDSGSGGSGHD